MRCLVLNPYNSFDCFLVMWRDSVSTAQGTQPAAAPAICPNTPAKNSPDPIFFARSYTVKKVEVPMGEKNARADTPRYHPRKPSLFAIYLRVLTIPAYSGDPPTTWTVR